MTPKSSIEILAPTTLIGYWQLEEANRRYFGALHSDAGRTSTKLTIGEITGGASRIVKMIENQDPTVKGIDARLVGSKVLFALEINEEKALQLASAELSALVDPNRKEVPFSEMRDLNLSDRQAARVALARGSIWNFRGAPRPERWLFSPRFVRGRDAPPAVVANAADGQAVLLGDFSGGETFVLADAAQPQMLAHQGRSIVAFKRLAEPYQPYWSLRQFASGVASDNGQLLVTEGEQHRSLSSDLKIGAVAAFELVADAGGEPWIFALRDQGSRSDVVALSRTDRGWASAATLPLDRRAVRLSVMHGAEGWRLIVAGRSASVWSLRYQTWTIPR